MKSAKNWTKLLYAILLVFSVLVAKGSSLSVAQWLSITFVGLFFATLYLIPHFVALYREHKQILPIFLLNLFTGWTLVGWVAALIWACHNYDTPKPKRNNASQERGSKEKKSVIERIGGVLMIIIVFILEAGGAFLFASMSPVKFIIAVPIIALVAEGQMKANTNDDDDWIDKLGEFTLGIMFGAYLMLFVFAAYNGLKDIGIDDDTKIKEQYEECLRTHHYNVSYCSYIKSDRY